MVQITKLFSLVFLFLFSFSLSGQSGGINLYEMSADSVDQIVVTRLVNGNIEQTYQSADYLVDSLGLSGGGSSSGESIYTVDDTIHTARIVEVSNGLRFNGGLSIDTTAESGASLTLGSYLAQNINNGVYIGSDLMQHLTTASSNVAIGAGALEDIVSGSQNICIGAQAGASLQTSSRNIILGRFAMLSASGTTQRNVTIGNGSFRDLLLGDFNTIVGDDCGRKMLNSNRNVFVGRGAAYFTEAGDDNVFVGHAVKRLSQLDSYGNTIIGSSAGLFHEGNDCVFIGKSSGFNANGDDLLYISNSSTETPLIWGDFANDSIRINGVLDLTDHLQDVTGGTGGTDEVLTWTTAGPKWDNIDISDGDSDDQNEIELPSGGGSGQFLTYSDLNILEWDDLENITDWIDVSDGDSNDQNEIELPSGGSNGQILSTNGSGVYTWVNDDDVDGDSNDQNEIELPSGGSSGQILSTDGSGVYSWVNDDDVDGDSNDQNEIELPSGGSSGQILSTDGSGVYTWINDDDVDGDSDDQNEIELPSGGSSGQILSTDGSGNYTWVNDDDKDADFSVTNEIELPSGGSSGQILSTNGSGVYSWVDDDDGGGGSSPWTLSGGASPKIYPTNSNAKVGVGTISPLENFHVQGIDPTMQLNSGLNNGDCRFIISDTPSVIGVSGVTGLEFEMDGSAQELVIKGREGMVSNDMLTFEIAQNQIGIQTDSPTAELDINGDLRLRGDIYDSTNSLGSTDEVLTKKAGGVEWTEAPVSYFDYGLLLQDGSSSLSTSTPSPVKFNFQAKLSFGTAVTASSINDEFTVNNNGQFLLHASLNFNGDVDGSIEVHVYINSTSVFKYYAICHLATENTFSVSVPMGLSSGDDVSVRYKQRTNDAASSSVTTMISGSRVMLQRVR